MDSKDVQFVMTAHSQYARKPSKAFRKADGCTPYAIHPIWCATTILAETSLDQATRKQGAIVLLYHDVLEDTTANLPEWMSPTIQRLVLEMTFESSDVEMVEVWKRGHLIRLLKLYDKVSNLLDGSWMNAAKQARYLEYTRRLTSDVEENYGTLNITRLAKALAAE